MKLLYLGKSPYNNKFKSLTKSLNIEIIAYKNPLKAIDNLTEIEPTILYFIKDDFPRHWKIVLSSLREKFSEQLTLFILCGELDDTERKAFSYLKGSAIIETGDDSINSFKKSISQISNKELKNQIYYPEKSQILLGFVKPTDFSFINGEISELNSDNIEFIPDNLEDLTDLKIGSKINSTSLSMGDVVITIDIEVKNISNTLLCSVIGDKKEYLKLVNNLFV
ncbi:MAG: hypothetical protein B6229_08705 [Spirochaetaceae bacterium 4572_7]|nr:MAG: hypothetical protein B6229_08705 [Spirochaetaceae bacterium 4572_7]